MPKGGKREGAGRKAGIPNKSSSEIKAIARQYGPDALKEAARLAGLVKGQPPAESEQARLKAIDIVLDRAYGKAAQAITGEDGEAIKAAITIMTGVHRHDGN